MLNLSYIFLKNILARNFLPLRGMFMFWIIFEPDETYFDIDFFAASRQSIVSFTLCAPYYDLKVNLDKHIHRCLDGQYSGKYHKNTKYDVL